MLRVLRKIYNYQKVLKFQKSHKKGLEKHTTNRQKLWPYWYYSIQAKIGDLALFYLRNLHFYMTHILLATKVVYNFRAIKFDFSKNRLFHCLS